MGDTEHSLSPNSAPATWPAGSLCRAKRAGTRDEADWLYFLSKGIVFGMRDRASRLVATAALLPYTASDAWISMVLVTESWRRRGLATRLVDTCLNTATRLGLTSWLDATPAGAAVYGPLGFTPTIQLRRLRLGNVDGAAAAPLAGKIDEFITCDIGAMGFDRSDLLHELGGRPTSRIVSSGDAMALVRDGRTARHIGPLFATTPAHALALLGNIVASEQGAVLIDAVASQHQFLKGLTDSGWTVERPFRACGSAAPPHKAPSCRLPSPARNLDSTMHHSEIKSDVRRLIADGTVLPAHPLALDANRKLDHAASARADALLHRCRCGRARGRCSHHAVRDPRCRAVSAGARACSGNGVELDKTPAGAGRGPFRPDRAGHRGSEDRGWDRLSRGPAQPCSDEIGHRRRDRRALSGDREGNSAGRVLSAAGGRRRDPERRFLAAICRDRQCRRDKDRAVQPLSHPRRLRGVLAAGALDRITLYTGNDDHIVLDFFLPFDVREAGVTTRTDIRGGLLGHWSVWTQSAIGLFKACKAARNKPTVQADLLALDTRVTDCKAPSLMWPRISWLHRRLP